MSRLSSTVPSRAAVAVAAVVSVVAVTLVPASGVENLQVPESMRPRSADAAERWWASCTADLPRSADAAERIAASCW